MQSLDRLSPGRKTVKTKCGAVKVQGPDEDLRGIVWQTEALSRLNTEDDGELIKGLNHRSPK